MTLPPDPQGAPPRLLQDPSQDPALCEELSQFHQQCQAAPFDLSAGLARFEGALSALPSASAASSTGAATTQGAAAVKGLGLLTGIKGIALATGGILGAGAVAWSLWPSPSPQGTQEKPSVLVPQAPVPAAPPKVQPPTSKTKPDPELTQAENLLSAELELVKQARKALASGQAKQALQLLEAGAPRFRSGALVPEREALTVVALHKSGQRKKARALGRRFLESHPRSPMAERVRRVLGLKR